MVEEYGVTGFRYGERDIGSGGVLLLELKTMLLTSTEVISRATGSISCNNTHKTQVVLKIHFCAKIHKTAIFM